MRGQIIIEKESGNRFIYVPEAHVQFQAFKAGTGKYIVATFRTDGYRQVRGGCEPTAQWLRHACQFTAEVDVPEDIVEFAIKSERERQDSVSDISDMLTHTLSGQGNPAEGLREFLKQVALESAETDEHAEHAIGERIQKIINCAGGLS